MVKKNIISSIIFLFFGIIFIKPSLDLGWSSRTSDGVPGAGFFPMIMIVGIIILSGYMLISNAMKLKQPSDFERKPTNRDNAKNVVILILSITIYLILWKLIGYYFATFIVAVLLNLYFKRTLIFTFVFSTVFVSLIYIIFTAGLKIQFVM